MVNKGKVTERRKKENYRNVSEWIIKEILQLPKGE